MAPLLFYDNSQQMYCGFILISLSLLRSEISCGVGQSGSHLTMRRSMGL